MPWWLKGLRDEVRKLRGDGVSALDCIRQSFDALGVAVEETDDFLSATLLALRGWGGMIWHVEERADRVHHAVPQGSLVDFVAVRLLLEKFAVAAAARASLGWEGTLAAMRAELKARIPSSRPASEKQRAFLIFQLAQVLGWTPEQLFNLTADQWTALVIEVEGFKEIDRRRVFHLAYEHRFRVQTLDALAAHPARPPEEGRAFIPGGLLHR